MWYPVGYIDPGTTQTVWTALAPVLGYLLFAISLAVWPLRYALKSVRPLLRRHAKFVALASAVAIASGIVLAWLMLVSTKMSSIQDLKQPERYRRVIVLGMDGLDPRRLERLMDAGELSNFSRLRDRGTFARLATTIPPESPVAWVSCATGMLPAKHGVFDFIHRDSATYGLNLSILRSNPKNRFGRRDAMFLPATDLPPLWERLHRRGIPTTVIRWPVTFPAECNAQKLLPGLGVPDVNGALGRHQYFTTADHADIEDGEGSVRHVSWDNGRIETRVVGPRVSSFTGTRATGVPMIIGRAAQDDAVSITLGDATTALLNEGHWSNWLPISFPGGLGPDIPAMARLYLVSARPDLKLYVTPLEVDPKRPAFPITHPEDYSAELASALGGRYHTLGMPEDVHAARDGHLPPKAFFDECDRITDERVSMLKTALDGFDEGLLAFVFDTSDRVQHMAWAADDADHPANSVVGMNGFRGEIDRHYKRMDVVLGMVLEHLSSDSALLLVSDHGFCAFRRQLHVNRWLIDNGYMALKEGNGEAGELFANVDWARTRAYAAGFSSVYINLRGRERKGIVRPIDRDTVIAELTAGLTTWEDPESKTSVIRNVYTVEALSEDAIRNAPDLVLGCEPGYRFSWRTALGAAPRGESVVDNTSMWAGDHIVDAPCVPGVLLSNIPGLAHNAALIDIAPTVLDCLGVSVSDGMDGRSLLGSKP